MELGIYAKVFLIHFFKCTILNFLCDDQKCFMCNNVLEHFEQMELIDIRYLRFLHADIH